MIYRVGCRGVKPPVIADKLNDSVGLYNINRKRLKNVCLGIVNSNQKLIGKMCARRLQTLNQGLKKKKQSCSLKQHNMFN